MDTTTVRPGQHAAPHLSGRARIAEYRAQFHGDDGPRRSGRKHRALEPAELMRLGQIIAEDEVVQAVGRAIAGRHGTRSSAVTEFRLCACVDRSHTPEPDPLDHPDWHWSTDRDAVAANRAFYTPVPHLVARARVTVVTALREVVA